ncbi:MAG: Rrf2 family transcriptional regulator [Oscillospiraceae bacterium]|nr:Rrf2 family transcriptional regulator [Oscillospiraceae bacterium]MDD4546558.1 Rrf2 family transcriptional regulator [Oscillospiraceae bacterium]
MHINLESDYAVRIVHCLSLEATQKNDLETSRLDAQTIADRTSVSLRFTLKIMRKLVVADLVKSYKGARGGYTLARLPKDITVRQVIEAVEGPYRFSRCMDGEYNCSCLSMDDCPFRDIFDEVTQLVIQKLDESNFDALSSGGALSSGNIN